MTSNLEAAEIVNDSPSRPARLEVQAERIPAELKKLPQWVVWNWTWNSDRQKWDKPPSQPHGARASVTNPDTWCDFATALNAYTSGFDGIGIVLTTTDPYFGVDLDDVWSNDSEEILSHAALELVRELDTYSELSPSGNGLRAFGLGTLPPGRRRRGKVEVYDSARYLTVTGHQLAGSPDGIRRLTSEEMTEFHGRLFPSADAPTLPEPRLATVPLGSDVGFLADSELLERARGARNGSEFTALFDAGRVTGSKSEATAALLFHLAFWTNKDPARMDRLFRQSALMRPKWDERRGESTWGQNEIQSAMQKCGAGFSARSVPAVYRPQEREPDGLSAASTAPVARTSRESAQIRLYSAEAIKAIRRPDWLIANVLPRHGFAVLVAPPGVGKSFLALDWGCSVATGTGWLGHPVTQGQVAYIAAEGASGMGLRLSVWEEVHGEETQGKIHFATAPVPFIEDSQVEALIRSLQSLPSPPELLVVDTMARCLGSGDENSSRDVGQFVAGLDRVREAFGCAVLLIHHSSKSKPANPRGSSALEGACDTMLLLGGSAEKLTLDCHKQKDAEPFSRMVFRLESAFGSCVISPADDRPRPDRNFNIRRMLLILQDHFGSEPASGTALKQLCELPPSTYHRALNLALQAGLVQNVGTSKRTLIQLTPAGIESISHLPSGTLVQPHPAGTHVIPLTTGASGTEAAQFVSPSVARRGTKLGPGRG